MKTTFRISFNNLSTFTKYFLFVGFKEVLSTYCKYNPIIAAPMYNIAIVAVLYRIAIVFLSPLVVLVLKSIRRRS